MNKNFNSQVEILEWLLQGKEVAFKSNKTETWKIIDNQVKYLSDNKVQSTATSTFQNFSIFEKVLNWYDNIPEQGVLCKCWNNVKSNYDIQRILEYIQVDECPLKARFDTFMNAVPLTKEEVLEFIYSEEQ